MLKSAGSQIYVRRCDSAETTLKHEHECRGQILRTIHLMSSVCGDLNIVPKAVLEPRIASGRQHILPRIKVLFGAFQNIYL